MIYIQIRILAYGYICISLYIFNQVPWVLGPLDPMSGPIWWRWVQVPVYLQSIIGPGPGPIWAHSSRALGTRGSIERRMWGLFEPWPSPVWIVWASEIHWAWALGPLGLNLFKYKNW